MRQLLVWLGGKRGKLKHLRPFVPNGFNTYYEPFAGGASMFFDLLPERAVLNDIDRNLMNMYIAVQQEPETVRLVYEAYIAAIMQKKSVDDRTAFYLTARDDYNMAAATHAARAGLYLFLNRYAFGGKMQDRNGLLFCTFRRTIESWTAVPPECIYECSTALEHANLYCEDYKRVLATARRGDFVFLDPPYDPDRKGGITKYGSHEFAQDKQLELKEVFDALTHKGVKVMETNNATPFIMELYSDYNMSTHEYGRHVSCQKNNSRTRATEVVITNY